MGDLVPDLQWVGGRQHGSGHSPRCDANLPPVYRPHCVSGPYRDSGISRVCCVGDRHGDHHADVGAAR